MNQIPESVVKIGKLFEDCRELAQRITYQFTQVGDVKELDLTIMLFQHCLNVMKEEQKEK